MGSPIFSSQRSWPPTFSMGGKKYLIRFHSAKTLPGKKKKAYFLAESSEQNRSQESCFWFTLNCTLNIEQYSCPVFILFTLHVHTQSANSHHNPGLKYFFFLHFFWPTSAYTRRTPPTPKGPKPVIGQKKKESPIFRRCWTVGYNCCCIQVKCDFVQNLVLYFTNYWMCFSVFRVFVWDFYSIQHQLLESFTFKSTLITIRLLVYYID